MSSPCSTWASKIGSCCPCCSGDESSGSLPGSAVSELSSSAGETLAVINGEIDGSPESGGTVVVSTWRDGVVEIRSDGVGEVSLSAVSCTNWV